MYMEEGMPRGGLHADYGATSPTARSQPGEYYSFRNNEIHNGFVVVTWNLADTGPEHGGFCCIPGSHKGNYKLPHQIAAAPEDSPCVVIPNAPAGSAILFTEALTHGTAAWNGKHQRRSLLYKYCVSHIAWTSRRVTPPADIELTERQKILFRDPADPYRHFPSLFDAA
jgi:ectoine hydroxylase-related dioxygenase (phytanoyl-CoA dioxygenase family)